MRKSRLKTRNKNIVYQGLTRWYCLMKMPEYWKFTIDVKKMSRKDSILNLEGYLKILRKYIHADYSLAVPGDYVWSYFYGYYKEMLKFAGMKEWIIPYIGEIEHGIRFSKQKLVLNNDIVCYTSQGQERINDVKSVNSGIPCLCIGAYTKYASYYYSDEKIQAIKKKWGKTLLLFPSHSYECDNNRSKGDSFLEWVYANYANKYDSIVACVYWNDLMDDDIKKYTKYGCKIVSAGFRGDYNFIRRLKTIIELSDTVIGNDIGTNIGYVLEMDKKFILYTKEIDSSKYKNGYLDEFRFAFETENGIFSDEQMIKQKELYYRFWGGDIFLSKDDVKNLFNAMKKIMIFSKFNVDEARKNIISEGHGNTNILSEIEQEILRKVLR
ncbi:MAG: hypothetical protein E7274_02525 [Pseudobutyrivibrio ruminis]|nr:hypothetical protein [Pseudobutyrivibrio ruminis]